MDIQAKQYSNYLDIVANIKNRPRMPLPHEPREQTIGRNKKRIRWSDRPLTKSSSSDQIHKLSCIKEGRNYGCLLEAEKTRDMRAKSHFDKLQCLQFAENNEANVIHHKCLQHKTIKLRRSASTNNISDVGRRCYKTCSLNRNVSCRHSKDTGNQQHQFKCHESQLYTETHQPQSQTQYYGQKPHQHQQNKQIRNPQPMKPHPKLNHSKNLHQIQSYTNYHYTNHLQFKPTKGKHNDIKPNNEERPRNQPKLKQHINTIQAAPIRLRNCQRENHNMKGKVLDI